jgi:hypothetical protein
MSYHKHFATFAIGYKIISKGASFGITHTTQTTQTK